MGRGLLSEAAHGSSEPEPEPPARKAYDKRIGMTRARRNLPQSHRGAREKERRGGEKDNLSIPLSPFLSFSVSAVALWQSPSVSQRRKPRRGGFSLDLYFRQFRREILAGVDELVALELVLLVVKLFVAAARRQQFFVRAAPRLFRRPRGPESDRLRDGREAVGDNVAVVRPRRSVCNPSWIIASLSLSRPDVASSRIRIAQPERAGDGGAAAGRPKV